MTARILDVSADDYHALPGFSSSVAKVVIEKSPLHAKAAVGKKPSKLHGAVVRGGRCQRCVEIRNRSERTP